jgi:hypothetical protein
MRFWIDVLTSLIFSSIYGLALIFMEYILLYFVYILYGKVSDLCYFEIYIGAILVFTMYFLKFSSTEKDNLYYS